MSNLVEDLWYKVTHRSSGEETEIQGRYLGVMPASGIDEGGHYLFQVADLSEPLLIHPDHLVDYHETVPPMPFPR